MGKELNAEIHIGIMANGRIPVEEHEVDVQAVEVTNNQENSKAQTSKTNGRPVLTSIQREALEVNARGFRQFGLPEKIYEKKIAEAKDTAMRLNGHRFNLEEIRANLRRLGYLKDEKPNIAKSNSANGNGFAKGGVFAENSPEEIDPKLQ